MAGEKLTTVRTIDGPDGDTMYAFGRREIEKPKLLTEPVGEIAAFSESGLGGKRHVFTANQVAEVQNMQVAERPDWI